MAGQLSNAQTSSAGLPASQLHKVECRAGDILHVDFGKIKNPADRNDYAFVAVLGAFRNKNQKIVAYDVVTVSPCDLTKEYQESDVVFVYSQKGVRIQCHQLETIPAAGVKKMSASVPPGVLEEVIKVRTEILQNRSTQYRDYAGVNREELTREGIFLDLSQNNIIGPDMPTDVRSRKWVFQRQAEGRVAQESDSELKENFESSSAPAGIESPIEEGSIDFDVRDILEVNFGRIREPKDRDAWAQVLVMSIYRNERQEIVACDVLSKGSGYRYNLCDVVFEGNGEPQKIQCDKLETIPVSPGLVRKKSELPLAVFEAVQRVRKAALRQSEKSKYFDLAGINSPEFTRQGVIIPLDLHKLRSSYTPPDIKSPRWKFKRQPWEKNAQPKNEGNEAISYTLK